MDVGQMVRLFYLSRILFCVIMIIAIIQLLEDIRDVNSEYQTYAHQGEVHTYEVCINFLRCHDVLKCIFKGYLLLRSESLSDLCGRFGRV